MRIVAWPCFKTFAYHLSFFFYGFLWSRVKCLSCNHETGKRLIYLHNKMRNYYHIETTDLEAFQTVKGQTGKSGTHGYHHALSVAPLSLKARCGCCSSAGMMDLSSDWKTTGSHTDKPKTSWVTHTFTYGYMSLWTGKRLLVHCS